MDEVDADECGIECKTSLKKKNGREKRPKILVGVRMGDVTQGATPLNFEAPLCASERREAETVSSNVHGA